MEINYLFHPQCLCYVRAWSKENIIKTIYRWELQFFATYESVTYLLGIKSNSTQLKKLHTSFSVIQYSAQMYLAWSSYNTLDFTLNKTSLDITALSLKDFCCNSISNSKKQCENRFIRTRWQECFRNPSWGLGLTLNNRLIFFSDIPNLSLWYHYTAGSSMKKQKWEKHEGVFEYWTATQAYPVFSKHLNCEMGAASGQGLASHPHTALPCLASQAQ